MKSSLSSLSVMIRAVCAVSAVALFASEAKAQNCGDYTNFAEASNANGRTWPVQWSFRVCNAGEVNGVQSHELIFRFRNTGSQTIEFMYKAFLQPAASCEYDRSFTSEMSEKLGAGKSVGGWATGHGYIVPKSQYGGKVWLCIVELQSGGEYLVAKEATRNRLRQQSRPSSQESPEPQTQSPPAAERPRAEAEEERPSQSTEDGAKFLGLLFDMAGEQREGALMGDFIMNLGGGPTTTKTSVSARDGSPVAMLGLQARRYFNLKDMSLRLEGGVNGRWMYGSSDMFGSAAYIPGAPPEERLGVQLLNAQPYAQVWWNYWAVGVLADWRQYKIESSNTSNILQVERIDYVPMVTIGYMHQLSKYFQISGFGRENKGGDSFLGGVAELGMGMLQLQLLAMSREVSDPQAPIKSDQQIMVTLGLRFP